MNDAADYSKRSRVSRRQAMAGLGAGALVLTGLAKPLAAVAQTARVGQDSAGFFRAIFPGPPTDMTAGLEMPTPQFLEDQELIMGQGQFVTARVGRLSMTEQFARSLARYRTGDSDFFLQYKNWAMALSGGTGPDKLITTRNFEAFETNCIERVYELDPATNTRPITVLWLIPYRRVCIMSFLQTDRYDYFSTAEAADFNRSFRVFPPS